MSDHKHYLYIYIILRPSCMCASQLCINLAFCKVLKSVCFKLADDDKSLKITQHAMSF